MEITKNKNATIKKQSSTSCFSMFTLLFAITLIPAFLTNRNLYPRGFLFLYMKRLYFEGVFLTLLNSGLMTIFTPLLL